MNKILWQLQLSNYANDQFILSADSNWQIMVTKLIKMLELDPDMKVDILMPMFDACSESPQKLLANSFGGKSPQGVNFLQVPIARNALRTRYDFSYDIYKELIRAEVKVEGEYTHVYVNDPLHLGNLKAMFFLEKFGSPKFIVQTHFLDNPGNQIAPPECSYWHDQVAAQFKADVCLWHCKSMEDVFFNALARDYTEHRVQEVRDKSYVWKDGYSTKEISQPVDFNNVRFDIEQFNDKKIVFVPNRVGGLGKSFDYTNNGKFLFEYANQLAELRDDFVIIAGNPNQKITNSELDAHCKPYVKLVDGALTRDEYRHLCRVSDVVVGLYTNDTNGGLASLEAIELGTLPLFPDIYEYKVYFDAVQWPESLRIKPDLSNTVEVANNILDHVGIHNFKLEGGKQRYCTSNVFSALQGFVRKYASYEHTTSEAMKRLWML